MQKRIYLAGPMSGLPELNYPAFHAKAAELRAAGHHVENPAENPAPPCGSWQGYMRMAIAQLVTCDAIHLLPGWEASRGAQLEFNLANEMGLRIEGEFPFGQLSFAERFARPQTHSVGPPYPVQTTAHRDHLPAGPPAEPGHPLHASRANRRGQDLRPRARPASRRQSRGRSQGAARSVRRAASMSANLYTPPVTSKKGVNGIGVPFDPYDESRRSPADSCGFFARARVMAARAGSRKARQLSQGVTGTPTCPSCRPDWRLGVSFCKSDPRRPVMVALALHSAPALVFQSTEFHPVAIDGQPCLRATELAMALGYADASSVNRIYARRVDEFTSGMSGSVKLTDPQGELQEMRVFSLRGAHLIAMFARTPLAKQFRRWVLDLLDGQDQSEPSRAALAERAARSLLDAVGQHREATRFVVDLRGHAQAIAQDQMLISWAELASTVADPNTLLSNAELATLNQVCAARLARRIELNGGAA